MLPDAVFKKSLMETFCMQYKHLPCLMEIAQEYISVSYNIIRISSELFGYEEFALQMVNDWDMLRVVVSNLQNMMEKILIPCSLNSN